jgi:hypothetical protein
LSLILYLKGSIWFSLDPVVIQIFMSLSFLMMVLRIFEWVQVIKAYKKD